MLAAKGTSHTSSLEQPPPQKKQTSIVGLATRNVTTAVASREPLSSIEQPPPQTKQVSIAEESISSRFQVASFHGAAQSAKNSSIEQHPSQKKQASKQRLEHTWAENWR